MLNNAQTTKTSLVLNFAPIDFENQQTQVGVIAYQNKEQVKLLRKQYASTHFFYQDRSTNIYVVPIIAESQPFGETFETIWLNDRLDLCSALMRNSLANKLFSMNRQIIQLDPLSFVAAGANDDLLAIAISKQTDVKPLDWLVAPVVYDIYIRRLYFDTETPLPGMALNVRSVRRINKPCSELLAEGLNLSGLYVGQKIVSEDEREAPHFRVAGRIKAVRGKQLILDDHQEGIEVVDADQVFIEGRRENFNLCLDHVLNNSSKVKADLERQLAALRDGPGKLARLENVIQFLGRMKLEILPGIPFTIQSFIDEEAGDTFPEVKAAPKPVFVFNLAGNRTNTWNDGGLMRFGPYTTHSFTPTRPNIAVICQSRHKGRVEQFLYQFFNGLEIKDGKPEYFPNGFIGKYRLDGYKIQFFQAEGNSPQAYRKAAQQVIEHQTDQNQKWDLVIIQIEDDFKNLRGDDNPYLTTKATFLQNQIPTQAFEIENAELKGRQSVFILNNMALAAYAKLGGVPWLLEAFPTVNHELVIGLGSAEVGTGRFGDRQKYVGITTVFSSDGAYRLSNISRAVLASDYQDELLQSLRKTVMRISQAMNWQKGDNVRLVFHVFKSLKNKEAEAVKALMGEFRLYKAEYAFLQIVEDHPFTLFDRQQQKGVYDPQLRINGKGKLVPERGLYFHLSRSETLLTVTGPKNVKRPEDGIPQPLLLRLHRSSTFYDMTYLARQVFTFSAHSWRTFFTVSLPVTILYSDLVARLLGELNEVSGWNPDVLLNPIGRSRWFL